MNATIDVSRWVATWPAQRRARQTTALLTLVILPGVASAQSGPGGGPDL